MKSSLYTRTGDAGTTSLVGGTRVSKADARLEAYGTIDELNSYLGLLVASRAPDRADRATLQNVQHRLFDVGTILATEPTSRWQPEPLPESCVEALEAEIDRLDDALPKHKRFILPGGHPDAAHAHVARTIARRAERRMVALGDVDPTAMRLINRLSDYLFALARTINMRNRAPEVFWEPAPKAE